MLPLLLPQPLLQHSASAPPPPPPPPQRRRRPLPPPRALPKQAVEVRFPEQGVTVQATSGEAFTDVRACLPAWAGLARTRPCGLHGGARACLAPSTRLPPPPCPQVAERAGVDIPLGCNQGNCESLLACLLACNKNSGQPPWSSARTHSTHCLPPLPRRWHL